MGDLGFYLLRLTLLVAGVGIAAGVYAGVARRPEWTRVAERAVLLCFAFVSVVMALLFNLISDLTGGLRVTVLEEDPPPRRTGSPAPNTRD